MSSSITQPEAARPAAALLVVTYHSGPAAIACLESIEACTYENLRVHVVDNASTDGTVAELRARFPDLRITVTPHNLGFGGGCNVGIEAALAEGAEHILLVNPDAVIEPGMVDALVDFLEAHPTAGAVGPKTYFLDSKQDRVPRLLYAGAFRDRLPLRQRVPGIGEPDPGGPDAPLEVDYIWGHGMAVRAEALRRVGTFDPAFFMYYEDIDLCVRLRRAGFGLWCEPKAIMWHDVPDGARAVASERWRWRLKAHGMAVFHRKHHGPLVGRCLSLLTGVGEAAQLLRQGHFRAFGHQVTSNLAHGLGFGHRSRG